MRRMFNFSLRGCKSNYKAWSPLYEEDLTVYIITLLLFIIMAVYNNSGFADGWTCVLENYFLSSCVKPQLFVPKEVFKLIYSLILCYGFYESIFSNYKYTRYHPNSVYMYVID